MSTKQHLIKVINEVKLAAENIRDSFDEDRQTGYDVKEVKRAGLQKLNALPTVTTDDSEEELLKALNESVKVLNDFVMRAREVKRDIKHHSHQGKQSSEFKKVHAAIQPAKALLRENDTEETKSQRKAHREQLPKNKSMIITQQPPRFMRKEEDKLEGLRNRRHKKK